MKKRAKRKLYIVLCLLLTSICLNACGDGKSAGDDQLAINSFAIGDAQGTVETIKENGGTQYVIVIALPEDTDFKHCVANIELQPGAEVSAESPCLVDFMGGRPILNLTLENRDLIVVCGVNSRAYGFRIELD